MPGSLLRHWRVLTKKRATTQARCSRSADLLHGVAKKTNLAVEPDAARVFTHPIVSRSASSTVELIVTTAFGLEAVVRRELSDLGYQSRTVQPGRLAIDASLEAIPQCNICLRSAERVLVGLGRFRATDFGQLFNETFALPWHQWLPADAVFPVIGRSRRSQLSSVPACQRIVKKAVAEKLKAAHAVEELSETAAMYRIEVALLDDEVTLSIDTTGEGLHKRGYRPFAGAAPLRETLAAALVALSYWKPGRPFIDPFCGTGTIAIEAALSGRNMAPGLNRNFAAQSWPRISASIWESARESARGRIAAGLSERLIATDIDPEQLRLARHHAELAGVADDIHFQRRSFAELTSKREYGCVITNPPYGERLGSSREVDALVRSIPQVLRRLPTWSHFILTAQPDFEAAIGQPADRRRKLYNGPIACQYYQFHGPKPPADRPAVTMPASGESRPPSASTMSSGKDPVARPHASEKPGRRCVQPVFGGLNDAATRQADEFRNRLAKRARHLRRWPARGVTCYRLYECDVPGVPLVVDRYEDHLHIAEFVRPHERTPAQQAEWLELMVKTAARQLDTPLELVFVKSRERQRGRAQYQRHGRTGYTLVVHEGGLKFRVNLSDYLDTGLFLDHRLTRKMVGGLAGNAAVLNLFGYTGGFTVYAAAGGAASTVTVDASRTYLDWARGNLELNNLNGSQHAFVVSDALDFLRSLQGPPKFDVAVVDPPTYSNSKDRTADWDVSRDHVELLSLLRPRMKPGGIVFFATNFRRFKLDTEALTGFDCRDITRQTIPEDFRNRRIHQAWRLRCTS